MLHLTERGREDKFCSGRSVRDFHQRALEWLEHSITSRSRKLCHRPLHRPSSLHSLQALKEHDTYYEDAELESSSDGRQTENEQASRDRADHRKTQQRAGEIKLLLLRALDAMISHTATTPDTCQCMKMSQSGGRSPDRGFNKAAGTTARQRGALRSGGGRASSSSGGRRLQRSHHQPPSWYRGSRLAPARERIERTT